MSDIRNTRDHEWVRLEDSMATVGIAGYAQDVLGNVVFIQLPQPGREVQAGEPYAIIGSVKAASGVTPPCPTGSPRLTPP